MGESLVTVEKHSMPLAEATTSSIEALKAYSTAMKVALSSGSAAAIPFFRRAVEIDPKFAMAHAQLGMYVQRDGESVLAAESARKAWLLRDRVSDRERFYIDFTYDRHVTGNLEKAYQTLELWAQTYPRAGRQRRSQESIRRHIHPWDRPISNGDRSIAQERIAADPDRAWRMAILRPAIFSPTVSPKLRARFSGPPSANWKHPDSSLSDTTSQC